MDFFYKTCVIHAAMKYPVVSAWEFEFLKEESAVRQHLSTSTIYMIGQRPMMYIDNLTVRDSVISFEITDNSNKPPLKCNYDPFINGLKGEKFALIAHSHHEGEKQKTLPIRNSAAFKILDENGVFFAWYSPSKFIYEYCSNIIGAYIDGDVRDYIDYKIHYVGKAYDQEIWKRLTGHHKLQRALTIKSPMDIRTLTSAHEISLITLSIDGVQSSSLSACLGDLLTNPALQLFDYKRDFDKYVSVDAVSVNHTNEVEAILVNKLRPELNEVMFDNYPNIKSGMRVLGYSQATLMIGDFPVHLKTDTASIPPKFPNIANHPST